jgi:exosortase family protein XrtM
LTKSVDHDSGSSSYTGFDGQGQKVGDKRVLRPRLRLFFNAHRQEIYFTFWFLLILAGLNYLYYVLTGTVVEDFVLAVMTAKPSVFMINSLTPGEQVVLSGTQITSQYVSFSVVSGCEGMGGILLIISAICAANVGLKGKLTGLFYGVTFVYLLNILRIVGLYYVMRYFSGAFEFAHYFVGQTVIIVLGCIFFIVWISRNINKNEKNAAV